VCSEPVDGMHGESRDFIDGEFALASNRIAAVTVHAHIPGTTLPIEWVDTILDYADADGLQYVTYADLVPGDPRPALALAFDDQAIDAWYDTRQLLAAHSARVTFFVTRWDTAWSERGKEKLHALAAAGHDVQPHSVNHLHAPRYARQHGVDAYVRDEVLPSIEALKAAGFHPTVFAFPFGESTPEITDAVLQHIDRVRVGPGSCPY
jgi:peptidoglycan/xylan/chitin deacetylase (PgdA/CDA1 family)